VSDDDALEPLVRSLTSAAGKDRVPQNSNKSNWKAKVKSPKEKTQNRRRRRRRRKKKKRYNKKRYNSSSSKGKQ
jgi:hypothetical protein